jgi:septation ring formation regulator EzrA
MVKKIVIVSLAVVAGLFLLSKTHMGSYVHTAWNKVSSSVGSSVPLEFEIDRIRDEIAQLDPHMQTQIGAIAKEVVAVENLQKEVGAMRVAVSNQKDAVLALRKEVTSGTRTVSFKGKDYTADKAKEKLQRDFDGYRRAESTLKSREALLEAKESALNSAREQLGSMRTKKSELEVAVAQLEAELKTLRVAQTKSNFQFDDSKLGQIKEAVAKLQTRLREQQVETSLTQQWKEGTDAAPATKAQSAELLKEIDDHFGANEVDVVDKK